MLGRRRVTLTALFFLRFWGGLVIAQTACKSAQSGCGGRVQDKPRALTGKLVRDSYFWVCLQFEFGGCQADF